MRAVYLLVHCKEFVLRVCFAKAVGHVSVASGVWVLGLANEDDFAHREIFRDGRHGPPRQELGCIVIHIRQLINSTGMMNIAFSTWLLPNPSLAIEFSFLKAGPALIESCRGFAVASEATKKRGKPESVTNLTSLFLIRDLPADF